MVDFNPSQNEKTSLIAGGFEFYLGADVKLGFAKLFVKSKANLLLKNIVPGNDTSNIPLLATTQIGVLIPLKRQIDDLLCNL